MPPNGTLRLDVSGTVVVPPFECAWLSGSGYELSNGCGCIVFEARAETDVTIILKPSGASIATKRLQPLQQRQQQQAPASPGMQTPSTTSGLAGQPEPNYTVIFGSHRNSCLKVEKNGSMVSQVQGVPGARLSEREFGRLWVDVNKGTITVGTGEPEAATISHQWVDPEPILNICHVGLSCWDRHVSYRCISVQRTCSFPVLAQAAHAAAGAGSSGNEPPFTTLFDLCSQQLVASLGAHPQPHPCEAARVAELLLPNTRPLYRACLDYLARHFREVSQQAVAAAAPAATSSQAKSVSAGPSSSPAHMPPQSEPQAPGVRTSPAASSSGAPEPQALEFDSLTATLLCDVLGQNSIAVPEKEIFDVVLRWARARGADAWAQSPASPSSITQQEPSSSHQPPVDNGVHGSNSSTAAHMELDASGYRSCPSTPTRHAPSQQQHDSPGSCAAGRKAGVTVGRAESGSASVFTEEARAAREEVGQVLGLIRYPLMPKEVCWTACGLIRPALCGTIGICSLPWCCVSGWCSTLQQAQLVQSTPSPCCFLRLLMLLLI